MKLCPQCEKENPSSANCCMYCGALLSEENLDETARLQRDLNDANNTILLLKQSLLTSQEQIKNNNYNANSKEIQSLSTLLNDEKHRFEKLLSEKENQLSIINTELASAKLKKSSSWGWIFVVLFIFACIAAIGFYSEQEEMINKISRLNSENVQLRNENSSTSSVNKDKITMLEDRIIRQNVEIDTLRKQAPQVYRVFVSEAYCYEWLGGNFKLLNSYYPVGTIVNVFAIKEDYALTLGGWLNLADLEKL